MDRGETVRWKDGQRRDGEMERWREERRCDRLRQSPQSLSQPQDGTHEGTIPVRYLAHN